MSEWKMTDADADRLIRTECIGNVGPIGVGMIVDAAVRLKIVMPVSTEADVRRIASAMFAALHPDQPPLDKQCTAVHGEWFRLVIAALGDNERA